MIFVTVGTERFPFDRLVRVMDEAVGLGRIRDEVFIQRGNSGYIPKYVDHTDYLDFPKMEEIVEKANIIVSHAGVGSTLLFLELRRIPILFPRRMSWEST